MSMSVFGSPDVAGCDDFSKKYVTDADIAEAARIVERLYAVKRRRRQDPPKHSYGGMTFGEIADELGCSKQRVHQIEKKALAKCARWCRRNGFCLEELLRR